MPTVFVIAHDWQLRANVRSELREQGVAALGMERVADAAQAVATGTMPDAVVLDCAADDADSAVLAQLARGVPLVLVASHTLPVPSLPAAAVLWRPVRVAEVVAAVNQVLKGLAA